MRSDQQLSATAADPEAEPTLRIPSHVYPYSAGVLGGLAGGLGMIVVGVVYGLISSYGIWYPLNLIAATLIRPWQDFTVAQLQQFSLTGVLAGLAIHLLMSTLLGFLFAVLLPTLPGPPRLWAFLVGPVLWAGAVFVALPLLNPIMARLVDLLSFAIANIVYNLILGFWVAHTPKIQAH